MTEVTWNNSGVPADMAERGELPSSHQPTVGIHRLPLTIYALESYLSPPATLIGLAYSEGMTGFAQDTLKHLHPKLNGVVRLTEAFGGAAGKCLTLD
jgi:hypothetical protein